MAPKRAAVTDADPPAPEAPAEEKKEKKTDAAAVRKLATHPSTAIMIREAIKELDSRKGVSSQAIQNYIKQKYPSVDLVRLKGLVRKALKKGLDNGTLVRPANATVTAGATGRFKLAPKSKEPKAKSENADPNVQNDPKADKDGSKGEAKKKKKTDAKKKVAKEDKSSEEPKPAKKSKKDDEEGFFSKVAAAKKPKAKKVSEPEEGEHSESVKPKGKAAKAPKEKPEKTGKASQNKQEKAGKAAQSKSQPSKSDGDAPATKAQGKRGKKASE